MVLIHQYCGLLRLQLFLKQYNFQCRLTLKLLRRSPVIVNCKYVFMSFSFLKLLSQLEVVAGIVSKILKATPIRLVKYLYFRYDFN